MLKATTASVNRGIGFQPVVSADRLEAYPMEFDNSSFSHHARDLIYASDLINAYHSRDKISDDVF